MNLTTKTIFKMFHIKIKLWVSFTLLISWCATAQIPNYNYERSLKGISDDWHSVTIPDNVFGKLQPSFKIYAFMVLMKRWIQLRFLII